MIKTFKTDMIKFMHYQLVLVKKPKSKSFNKVSRQNNWKILLEISKLYLYYMISTIITPAIKVSNILVNKREQNIKNKLLKNAKFMSKVMCFSAFFKR